MVRTVIGCLFVVMGLLVYASGVVSVFRFRYVLNRMQGASLMDTLGAMCLFAGLAILMGFSLNTAKLALILIFLWIASPVASHMLSRAEVMTHAHIEDECRLKVDRISPEIHPGPLPETGAEEQKKEGAQ